MTWASLVLFVCGASVSPNLASEIEMVAEEYHVEKTLLLGMIYKESTCRPNVVGSSGDTGLMQIVPKWHQDTIIDLSVEDLFDPLQNMRVGASILVDLGVQTNPHAALVVYNGGYARPRVSYRYASDILYKKETYDTMLYGE